MRIYVWVAISRQRKWRMIDRSVRLISDLVCLPFKTSNASKHQPYRPRWERSRPIIARRYNHHPWPDSRTHRPLPSRHVTCPTSIHYFRSVTRRRSAAVLCYSPSSVYFRFRSKSGEALSGIRTHSSSTTSNFDICGPKTRLHAGASTVSQESRLVTPDVTLTDRERWNLRYRCTFTPLCSYGCYRSSWSRLVSDLRPTTTHVTSSSQRGEAKLHSDRFGLRWR